ncbi:MAG: hypothetical protein M4579_000307 [Chaenotheca gracillima]|nr:MAG: hypothetical protein M4579_000307 [Chaenotheca gracillima]
MAREPNQGIRRSSRNQGLNLPQPNGPPTIYSVQRGDDGAAEGRGTSGVRYSQQRDDNASLFSESRSRHYSQRERDVNVPDISQRRSHRARYDVPPPAPPVPQHHSQVEGGSNIGRAATVNRSAPAPPAPRRYSQVGGEASIGRAATGNRSALVPPGTRHHSQVQGVSNVSGPASAATHASRAAYDHREAPASGDSRSGVVTGTAAAPLEATPPSNKIRFADNERPSRFLWWLSGGTGKAPTGRQLRARKDKHKTLY